MDKVHDFLVEWAERFVRNKDILEKRIESIEKKVSGFDFVVRYGDKEQFFIVNQKINDLSFLDSFEKDKNMCIVTLNDKSNLDIVLRNWKKLSEYKFLSIIFVNPFSQLDKKWIIHPYTHNKICDKNSLELGLKAMFEVVEPIKEEGLLLKLNNK